MKKLFNYSMKLVHYNHDLFIINKIKKSLLIGLCVFVGVFLITKLGYNSKLTLLIPPIAASLVIIFAIPHSPFSRPKNIILSHLFSGVIGVSVLNMMNVTPLSLSIALSLAVFTMLLTNTLHPPAGATTILIMLTNASWNFILFPLGVGAIIVCIISILYRRFHNFIKEQKPTI